MQSPWINDAEFLGYFVAIEENYYERERLGLKYLSGGPEVIAEGVLLSGRAQLALAPLETTASLVAREKVALKIIGAQYQVNPLGIVSLKKSGIRTPADLSGKRLAVPQANVLTVRAFLEINGVPESEVRIVPYSYDPSMLMDGRADATIDFVTNVPFTIRELGGEPEDFLLSDFGFSVFQDVVVVEEDVLRARRPELVSWLRASRDGWERNFENVEYYPAKFMNSWFRGTGRKLEHEIEFNRRQRAFIETAGGIFSMSEQNIGKSIETLAKIGIHVERSLFVTDLVDEIGVR